MKDVVIGIIGGTGGMGRWFADLLQKEGYVVYVWGRKSSLNLNDLIKLCNVIVIAVPISATAEMIKQVGPLVTEKKLLMDLTSLKKEPVELMLTSTPADVIGCHPLFGPLLPDVTGQNVVLCPARGNKWLIWLENILEKNGLIVMERTPEEHDEMMAIVQALNHLNTISLGLVLAETGIPLSEINKFSTPIFQTKVEIIKKVFTDNPGLYTDIISQNPATEKMLDLYGKTLSDIRVLAKSGNGKCLKEAMEQAAKKLF
ncbi:MAG: prephenate dehydrogenase/arogenate dehydrogenase family protein [Smithellaceae bacterium]